MFEEKLQHIVFQLASEYSIAHQQRILVVGGFVRDLFLGLASSDIDFVVEGDGVSLAQFIVSALPGKPRLSVFKAFGTAHFSYDGIEWEFVGARKESYRSESRNPEVEAASIEEDQKRRDFTINALGIEMGEHFGRISDPFEGIRDLKEGIVRTPLDPLVTFNDDPLRMLRAVRFAARFDFYIEDSAFKAMHQLRERVKILAPERIAEELNKMLMCSRPSKAFWLMERCGILDYILPELTKLKGVEYFENKGHKDNFHHTLEVLDNLSQNSDNLWLRWGALLHDIGKARTKKFVQGIGWTFHAHDIVGAKMVDFIFARLKMPKNEKLDFVKQMVALHLRPIALVEDEVTDSAVRRLLFDAGDNIDSLMTLCEADITSKNKVKVERFIRNFKLLREKLVEVEESDRLRNWQPPITGELIMETFDIEPCREVGIIKSAIREAILDGIISNDLAAAYGLMLEEGRKLGLSPVKKLDL